MSIRQDYIHHITVTSERRVSGTSATETSHALWKGTSQQIAEQVAAAVKSQLDYGATSRIELTPISPSYVTDLGQL